MAIKSQKNKKFKNFMRSLSRNQQTQLLKKYKNQDLTMLEIYEKKYKRFIGTSPGTKNLMKDNLKKLFNILLILLFFSIL